MLVEAEKRMSWKSPLIMREQYVTLSTHIDADGLCAHSLNMG